MVRHVVFGFPSVDEREACGRRGVSPSPGGRHGRRDEEGVKEEGVEGKAKLPLPQSFCQQLRGMLLRGMRMTPPAGPSFPSEHHPSVRRKTEKGTPPSSEAPRRHVDQRRAGLEELVPGPPSIVRQAASFAAFSPAIWPKTKQSSTALPPTRFVPWMPPVISPAA